MKNIKTFNEEWEFKKKPTKLEVSSRTGGHTEEQQVEYNKSEYIETITDMLDSIDDIKDISKIYFYVKSKAKNYIGDPDRFSSIGG